MGKFIYPNYDLGRDPSREVVEIVPFLKSREVQTILDYHCGGGRNAVFLCNQGFQVIAADYADVIKKLKEIAKSQKLPIKLSTLLEDQASLDFPGTFFDAILSWRWLHRGTVEQRESERLELGRITKQGGYLIATVSSSRDVDLD